MRKILYSRLPERVADRVPPILVELAVGVTVALVFVYLRSLFGAISADRVPYALNFLAVVLATLIAGWRSGIGGIL